MDNYLESLVLKGEKTEETVPNTEELPAEEEVVAEIAEAVAEPDDNQTEVKAEVAPEESKESEIEEKSEVEADKPATVTIKAESAKKEPVNHPDIPVPTPEEPAAVVDIRIYNTPDPKGPFKFFSGNVMVKDKVASMTMIEYMKPGFGLVKGFTPDLK